VELVMQQGDSLELLALIMEREGYLSRSQIEQARALQGRLAELGQTVALGDIVEKLAFCTATDVRYARSIEVKLEVAAGQRRPLGYYLLEIGALLPSQLLEGLEEQAFYGSRLGEILVRNQWVTAGDVDHCLALQKSALPVDA
jgi:hypothetical protein